MAIIKAYKADERGNLVEGNVVTIDTRDTLVFNDAPGVTAVVGLNGVVVVRTEDAVLVIPRHRAQDVRYVVDALRRDAAEFT